MGTDTGSNLLEPGATPHENHRFLFFCAAVIQAVNKHQALLRASIASPGQDHRLGANEAPPAIISVFLGAELEKVFDTMVAGSGDPATPKSELEFGATVLPALPKHGGDRNRTSPFAFTGNKFEFRALGSSQSLALPNTVLNTIVAEAIDDLADKLEAKGGGEEAVLAIARESYADNKRIVFSGDNYSEDWHQEAEERGLFNLKQTPDALPWLINEQTVAVFSHYGVLSERELESRYEVFLEQYTTKLNIEAETATDIARTQLLPAALQYMALLDDAENGKGVERLQGEIEPLVDDFVDKIFALEAANAGHPETEDVLEAAKYVQSTVIPAMEATRDVADRLERIVPDSLWPLPQYAEFLFIK
jgi:glutamine synthetase